MLRLDRTKSNFKFLILIIVLFFITLNSSSFFAQEDINLEENGYQIADTFIELLDSSVEDTLIVAGFDLEDPKKAKIQIERFSASRQKGIWYNIGSDENPVEKREIIPLYKDISFIDRSGKEILKYKDSHFFEGDSDRLKDVSILSNTEFLSETYFEKTIGLEEGVVNIGDIMTWYISKEEVFKDVDKRYFDDYEKVPGRDFLKQGIIRFSSPVYKQGELKGIVVLSLDYRHMQELTKHIDPGSNEPVLSTPYEGNYVLVYDKDGNTIIHPKPDNIRGYLEDGLLAGLNDPDSSRKGTIFNLYRYKEIITYNLVAKNTLEEKNTLISQATDISGRKKLIVAVPILYSNNKTNYKDIGVYGGLLLSINLEQEEVLSEMPLTFFIAPLFLLIVVIFMIYFFFTEKEYFFRIKILPSREKGSSLYKKLLAYFIFIILFIVAVFSIFSFTDNLDDNLMTISALMISLSTLLAFWISKNITSPIKQLDHTIHEIMHGNLKARVDIKTGDELEKLGKAFNKTAYILDNTDKERKQIDKAKTEFISITSHELRSPMTPMRAQLQMLMKGYYGKLDNDKQKQALDIVLRNTERLDKIIVDFLEISRIEAARLKFVFIKTSLNPYIKRIIQEMKGFMPEKNIKIISNIGKLPIIEVDPDRVMQVLRNLINNAIKFTPEKGKVKISAEPRKKDILFIVKDDGIGISEENQIRIFEPFFQEEQTIYRKHGGTGLGLAICKGIVESQEGRIWLESKKGKGTSFYFTIPLKPVKQIKPIKLLFSPKRDIENKIKSLFIEYLGPLGISEFKDLKKKNRLDQKTLLDYIELLVKAQIISQDSGNIFRKNIVGLFKKG